MPHPPVPSGAQSSSLVNGPRPNNSSTRRSESKPSRWYGTRATKKDQMSTSPKHPSSASSSRLPNLTSNPNSASRHPQHPASIHSTASPPSKRPMPSSTGAMSLVAPTLSSPIVSSPTDSYFADPFSPPAKRSGRFATPSSPTHITGEDEDEELVAETQVDDPNPSHVARAPVLIPASSPIPP